MNHKKLVAIMVVAALTPTQAVFAEDLDQIKAEIDEMRNEYEKRIAQLEQRLAQAEAQTKAVSQQVDEVASQPLPTQSERPNTFNPAISMILNGQFNSYQNNPDNYRLDGFPLQSEAGLERSGFSLGESEITLSASIDPTFRAQSTISLHDSNGSTEVGLEEIYIETLGLNNGMTVRAGRFYSPIGYLNEKHSHAWNFADAPLIYRGLFGNQLATDGLKLSYLLPTDLMVEVGATVGNGDQYPGSGSHNGIGDWLLYAKTGGDIGIENSWQAGLAYWQTKPSNREYATTDSSITPVSFSGTTDITNLSLIYKWAPNGNIRQRNVTLQSEFFYANNDGHLNQDLVSANYAGRQYGGYLEGIYQFNPRWRTGVRYDWVGSHHRSTADQLLADAGLDSSVSHPQRYSWMIEWLPSEFSRLRAQLNYDQSYSNNDTQLMLQYTVSMGAHGAHNY